MYEVWRFIAPALYAGEKRLAIPFVLLATLGTACGVLFNTYLLFPAMMKFFAGFSSPHIRLMPRIEDTYDQFLRTTLGMVVVFQMPTLALFLKDASHHGRAALAAHQIRRAVDFYRRRRVDALGRPVESGGVRRADAGLHIVSIALAWVAQPRKSASEHGSRPLRWSSPPRCSTTHGLHVARTRVIAGFGSSAPSIIYIDVAGFNRQP
jgi:hypothetical protein